MSCATSQCGFSGYDTAQPFRYVDRVWNVMAQAQKPDFVFRRNGRVHLNRRGCQFSRLLAAEMCASAFIVGSNAGYTMFRGSVKGTGYPLHSSVSPSLPLACVTVCHHISTGLYLCFGGGNCCPIFRVEISWVRKVVDYIKMEVKRSRTMDWSGQTYIRMRKRMG